MGLKSVIFLAVAGPLLMYGLLMSHVVYQVLTPLFQNMKLLKKLPLWTIFSMRSKHLTLCLV